MIESDDLKDLLNYVEDKGRGFERYRNLDGDTFEGDAYRYRCLVEDLR